MQQEDDLRGLAKVMEFMRAISIIFIVVHIYWFCYQAIVDMGINIGVVDKILLNFQNTAGLFSNLLVTKVFAIIFLALSCLGTKGVKNQKMTWQKIYATFLGGLVLFFMNWWLLDLPFSPIVNMAIYTVTMPPYGFRMPFLIISPYSDFINICFFSKGILISQRRINQ